MIRSLFLFIFICIFTLAKGQYEPQFSQNMFTLLSVHPGFAGRSGQVGIVALHRSQWIGLEGAPTTDVLGVDAGLKFLGFEHGLGFNALKDNIGSFDNLRFSLSYSLKFDLAVGQISTGANLGFINQTLDGSKLYTDPKEHKVLGVDLGSDEVHKALDKSVPKGGESG